ncbi:MAG: LysR family transcriptional regulator, partial [Deltaproteobacteria bacterium]|nr:LysR family transcriptional regulator [Deltaproteobacteria bacterium]
MTLDRLKVFVAAARYRSVTRASEELFITQPAVTKQLKSLERDFNTHLYRRNGRGIELTEAGQVFLGKVKKILRSYDSLIQTSTVSRSAAKVKTLTVGGSYSPSAVLLPSLLARFKKRHPRVDLNLRTDNRLNIERLILKGEVELAIINNPPANHHLAMEPFLTEPWAAFVASDHPLAGKNQLTWEDLGRIDFIMRRPLGSPSLSKEFIRSLKDQGVTVKAVMHCESPEAVKVAVSRSVGVGILFKDVISDSLKKGEFKELTLPVDGTSGKSYIVYHKSRPLSPLAQDFLSLLRQRRDRSIKSQTRRKKTRRTTP